MPDLVAVHVGEVEAHDTLREVEAVPEVDLTLSETPPLDRVAGGLNTEGGGRRDDVESIASPAEEVVDRCARITHEIARVPGDGSFEEAPILERIPQVVAAVDVHDDDVGGLQQTEMLQNLQVFVRTDPTPSQAVGRLTEKAGALIGRPRSR